MIITIIKMIIRIIITRANCCPFERTLHLGAAVIEMKLHLVPQPAICIYNHHHLYQMSPERGWIITLASIVWVFSAIVFDMSPQITRVWGCIVTLVAFVWLFCTVCFKMCPQMACLGRYKVTLVAFVWFFSTVRFQMCPQSACLGGGIVTLVAFVWVFTTVCY